VTTLDLTLLPIYRLNQQELSALPGLLAMTPPRKTARGRERDRLLVYLVLTGNATLSTAEYLQLTSQTASSFFETPGALTTAMRIAAEALNRALLDRNMNSTTRGQYVVGWLVLAALRGGQCTMLQSGPTHIYKLDSEAVTHTFDPALSGKGLGLSQATTIYLTQSELHPGDRLVFSAKPPARWDGALKQVEHDSPEAVRRQLLSLSRDDLNAVIIQTREGTGNLTVLRPTPSSIQIPEEIAPISEPPAPPAESENLPPFLGVDPSSRPGSSSTEAEEEEPAFTPSAYAIPPQTETSGLPTLDQILPEFPASIPRLTPGEAETSPLREMDEPFMDENEPKGPRQPSETTRRVARGLVGGMRAWRRTTAGMGTRLGKILPNLFPQNEGANSSSFSSNLLLALIAIAIPLMVVTAGFVMYSRFGRSIQYDRNMIEAENARTRAISAADPARERTEWQTVMFHLREAEKARNTPELETFRREAQNELDALEGIQRLNFFPALTTGIGAPISRLAANETDLYILDAEQGRVLHAARVGNSFEMDAAFRCEQGDYGDYHVGPIVDILTLPRLNSLNAAVLGIDAGGTLLYCAPGQVGQAIPLPLPETNWGRVTGFTYDSGNLYVLDAPSRAVWVYTGRDASFVEQPYFFFGGQIPEIEDSIDLVINGDEMYLLHADSHLSHCAYSRLDTVPTRCEDPVMLVNKIEAYKDIDLFGQVHFTQMMLTSPPDLTLLLLDADTRSVMRFSPRSLELLNQIYPMPGTSIKPGPAGAMTVNPNRVLFLAVDDQVYFASDVP
jgi:hypothetical protein